MLVTTDVVHDSAKEGTESVKGNLKKKMWKLDQIVLFHYLLLHYISNNRLSR